MTQETLKALFADSVVNRVKIILQATNNKELATLTGVSQEQIAEIVYNDTIPSHWERHLVQDKGVNPEWLFTGKGPVFIKTRQQDDSSRPYIQNPAPEAMPQHDDLHARPMNLPLYSLRFASWLPNGKPQLIPVGEAPFPLAFIKEGLAVFHIATPAFEPEIQRETLAGVDMTQTRPACGKLIALTALPSPHIVLKRLTSNEQADSLFLMGISPLHASEILMPDDYARRAIGVLAWTLQKF